MKQKCLLSNNFELETSKLNSQPGKSNSLSIKILIFSLSLLFLFGFPSFSQEVVIEESVTEEVVEKKFGPNRLHYVSYFMDFGLSPFGHSNQTYKTNLPWSFDFQMGLRYKLKLHNFYALGAQLYWGSTDYDISYDETSVPNGVTLYDQEFFSIGGWGFELFQRINFDKRGNTLGKFLDLGAYIEWLPYRNQTITIEQDETALYSEQIITNRKLKYVNNSAYGLTARIGINKLSIYAKYRLSELVNDEISEPNLGFSDFNPLNIGISLAF